MEFKFITNMEECKLLWEKFSPKKSVWDLWEITYPFHRCYSGFPFFILGIKDREEVGILHLEIDKYDNGEEYLDFFGADYPERRTFYVQDRNMLSDFFSQARKKISLSFIDPSEKDYIPGILESDVAYSLDLSAVDYDIKIFFARFNKKHRKNLRNDLKQIERLGYAVFMNYPGSLDFLAKFNRVRFGAESDFSDPKFYESIKLLVESAEKLNILQMLSIEIAGKVEASQIALFYNGVYTVLTGGSNSEIKNLGKLLIIEHIKNAIKLKANIVDFMTYESGWKKLWNLDETMLYKFEK